MLISAARRMRSAAAVLAAAFVFGIAVPAPAQDAAVPSIADKTRGLERRDGYVPLYWDARAGKVWMEIPRFGEEMIYQTYLPWGMGSNDICRTLLPTDRSVGSGREGLGWEEWP